MHARRLSDPHEFAAIAEALGGATPGRHNLILGLAGTLVDHPSVYPDFRLWVVDDDGAPVLAGIRTLPYNLVLTDASGPEPVRTLLAAIEPDTPGVVANVPTIDWAVEARLEQGGSASRVMAQGVFEATEVDELPPPPPGSARAAVPADRDLLVEWITDFAAEATPESSHPERIAQSVDRRFDLPDEQSALLLWEVDGEVRALSGHGGRSAHGIRVGPVYTPPQWRGRGYATALVAHQTRWLLEHGNPACFLYTDLSNPTSNAIYQRIGYRQVAESGEWRFTPAG